MASLVTQPGEGTVQRSYSSADSCSGSAFPKPYRNCSAVRDIARLASQIGTSRLGDTLYGGGLYLPGEAAADVLPVFLA